MGGGGNWWWRRIFPAEVAAAEVAALPVAGKILFSPPQSTEHRENLRPGCLFPKDVYVL